jgi:uncharacterized protein (DUF433 family)
MGESKTYVMADGQGVWRVKGTRISMDSVVIGFQQGQSAEEIQRNFPELDLEQVYGTIAHYLSHREEIDDYLRKQRIAWDQLRAKAESPPSAAVERLRKARAGMAGHVR